eukprot:3873707-Prymnesium_polylepis.1
MMPRGPRGVAAHDRAACSRSRCLMFISDLVAVAAGGGRGAVIWSEGRRDVRPLWRACGVRA